MELSLKDLKEEVPPKFLESFKGPIIMEEAQKVLEVFKGSEKDQHIVSKKKKPKKKIVFFIGLTKYPVVKYVGKKLLDYKLSENPDDLWDVMWTDSAVPPDQFDKLKLFQKVNHFPGMYSLARKNHLGRHLMRMREKFPNFFRFFPKTYLLPADYSIFKASCLEKNKTFIVKPEASCQGRGIYLTRNYENVDPMDHVVIQNYLERPYLIDNLKFDLRIYVLLTGCDPLRVFIYKEGLARFATEEYKPPKGLNLENLFMHLTNYAINKKNKNFIFNKDPTQDCEGHKRSLSSVLKLLENQGHDVDNLMHEIEKMIVKMFCSVQPILSHNYYSCQSQSFRNDMCFELLGLDILLDHKLKPYLIEVNHTPSFTTDTPLDKSVKRHVIRDSLILMNIEAKNRIKYFKDQKKEFEKRIANITKINASQKETLIKKARLERDLYEKENLGGFKKLFPQEEEEEPYQDFMEYAKVLWEKSTGTFNPKKNEEMKKNEEIGKKNEEIGKKNEEIKKKNQEIKKKNEEIHQRKTSMTMNSSSKRSQSQSSSSTKNTIASKAYSMIKIPRLESKQIVTMKKNAEIVAFNGNNGKFVNAKILEFGGFGGFEGLKTNRNSSLKYYV